MLASRLLKALPLAFPLASYAGGWKKSFAATADFGAGATLLTARSQRNHSKAIYAAVECRRQSERWQVPHQECGGTRRCKSPCCAADQNAALSFAAAVRVNRAYPAPSQDDVYEHSFIPSFALPLWLTSRSMSISNFYIQLTLYVLFKNVKLGPRSSSSSHRQ